MKTARRTPNLVPRTSKDTPGVALPRRAFRPFALLVKGILMPVFVLLVCTLSAPGAEYVLGAGVVGKGYGARFYVHPDNSHWRFGWEYGRAPAHTEDDPFTGRPLTRDVESLTGPFFQYQFKPSAKRGWYLGASLLRWTRTETSLTFDDSSTTSTTDLYFGGGYLARLSRHFLLNAGMFIAPGASMTTETSTSSTENSGGFDLQLTLEFAF